MRKIYLFLCLAALFTACKQPKSASSTDSNKDIAKLFDNYYEDRLKLYPLEATSIGDKRYNDLLPNDGSAAFIKQSHDFYVSYLDKIKAFNREDLNEEDKLSYDIFVYEMNIAIDGYKHHFEYMPFNQMFALPLTIGQYGSGSSSQPFKTVKDYDDWLKRLSAFAIWADTAQANFDKGIKAGDVMPKALVVKMIPQMESMAVTDPEKSLFYTPITTLPKYFTDADKKRLTDDYKKAIMTVVVPTYKKLGDYLKTQYLPHARSTSGYSSIPDGAGMYRYLVRQQTTTNKTPEAIYQLGLKEVARIRGNMDSIKNKVGFKGDLKSVF